MILQTLIKGDNMSEAINLESMTGKEIINLVRRKTNKRITLSPKSKKSIVKMAKEYFGMSSAIVEDKKDQVENVLYLPDSKVLRNKVSEKDIQDFLKEFAAEKIISRTISSHLATAFALIESKEQRVADVIMDANEFCKIRRFSKSDVFDSSCKASELKRGLMGWLWGARVWVQNDAKGIVCYPEKTIEKKYPFIAESKKILKIKD